MNGMISKSMALRILRFVGATSYGIAAVEHLMNILNMSVIEWKDLPVKWRVADCLFVIWYTGAGIGVSLGYFKTVAFVLLISQLVALGLKGWMLGVEDNGTIPEWISMRCHRILKNNLFRTTYV